MTIQFDEDKQKQKLSLLRQKQEEEFIQNLSSSLNIPYTTLTEAEIDLDALRTIPEQQAREAKVVIFSNIDKKIKLAAFSPEAPKTKEIIDKLTNDGFSINLFLTTNAGLERAFDKYKHFSFATKTDSGSIQISDSNIENLMSQIKTTTDVKNKIEEIVGEGKKYKISDIFEIIIAGAVTVEASDIHIETEESFIRLRYRLDGVLNDVLDIKRDTHSLLVSRIKLVSGLKLNITNEAQDGRFTVKIGSTDIEIRTSVLPGNYGESVVLRILNPKSIAISLEELGMGEKLLKILEREIQRPNGLILNTGPTGSGKTTTLYAFLKKVSNPEIKIITIENPIEYHLPGIVQTQTDSKSGYTFLSGLRSALRQDPDIIMVGEIRDSETANIAINAALTGHLVFSTLHTNNAAGAFPRLIDLGVNPKTLTSAVNISMAQRLVRKLCNECKEQTEITGNEKKIIEEVMNSIKDPEYKDVQKAKMWKAKGCIKCNFTGYKGRIGIYEAIITNSIIEKIVRENPSEREIKKASFDQEILDMKQDGVLKILKGVTSFDELKRVIDLLDYTDTSSV